MKNRHSTQSASQRKQGHPAGLHTSEFFSETKAYKFQEKRGKEIVEHAEVSLQIPSEEESERQGKPLTTKESSEFSQLLRSILRQDRSELLRVAEELAVSENSIYRWMSGNTEPRMHHLKRLPEVLPAYRELLTEVINATFHSILQPQTLLVEEIIEEIPKEIYQHVIELITMIDDLDIRFWEVSQFLFEHALNHLDKERQGMAITYARLLSPHVDGIHAMREVTMRGHAPWPMMLENKVYLGSTSLAGMAATLQRMQIWHEKESEQRLQVKVDEYERSACATPLVRGNRIAGVLTVSSTNADFFHQAMTCRAIGEYAQLLALALPEQDFQPFSSLHLRPMPELSWQHSQLAQHSIATIVAYACKHHCSRQEAEQIIEREIECDFERLGQEQQQALQSIVESKQPLLISTPISQSRGPS